MERPASHGTMPPLSETSASWVLGKKKPALGGPRENHGYTREGVQVVAI